MSGDLRPRLVVMAHFDPDGQVAPHVRRHVEALRDIADDLIVVTTAELTGDARGWLASRCTLIERENVGYDFLSYQRGLEQVGDLTGYREVVICNDTFIGPLVPYDRIFASMDTRAADFWGMTQSNRLAPHVQSFFVVFRAAVVASEAFRSFWTEVIPLRKRSYVIRKYEVGLSVALRGAGFTMSSYFRPGRRDRLVARIRVAWWATLRNGGRFPLAARGYLKDARRDWNPCIALADRALDPERLPLIKIDTLRFDSMGLDSVRLLTRCEQEYPEALQGVREFLERTADRYPVRPGEEVPPPKYPARVLRPLIGYC